MQYTVSTSSMNVSATSTVLDAATTVKVMRAAGVLDTDGLLKLLKDFATTSDVVSVSSLKALADAVSQTESLTTNVQKLLADEAVSADFIQVTIVIQRFFADFATIVDEGQIDPYFAEDYAVAGYAVPTPMEIRASKPISDAGTTTYTLAIDTTKPLADSMAASELRWFQLATAFQDGATAADVAVRAFTKIVADTSTSSETGFIYKTDYVDIAYFAGDYVGSSLSF